MSLWCRSPKHTVGTRAPWPAQPCFHQSGRAALSGACHSAQLREGKRVTGQRVGSRPVKWQVSGSRNGMSISPRKRDSSLSSAITQAKGPPCHSCVPTHRVSQGRTGAGPTAFLHRPRPRALSPPLPSTNLILSLIFTTNQRVHTLGNLTPQRSRGTEGKKGPIPPS